jgi:tetratricopeptide (TPR) repeat protein
MEPQAQSDVAALTLYQQSPRESHHFLKQKYNLGETVKPLIRPIEQEFGDFSFATLKSLDKRNRSGMRLQRAAHQAWEGGDPETALILFRRARDQLSPKTGETERAFCSYFRAEILSDQGKHQEGLDEVEEALQKLRGAPVLYLSALLQQSRGFSLWYLDRLPESIAAFGSALEIWLRISCDEGVLAAWNNLAALYEELGITDRALSCYLEALSLLRNGTAKEVRGLLLLNFAGFLYRSGDQERARRFLELSRPYQRFDPGEFLLTEAEITGNTSGLLDLDGTEPSYGLRRLMLEAQMNLAANRPESAERLLLKALTTAREAGLSLYERKVAIQLAGVLEFQGRWSDAERLYSGELGQAGMLLNLDVTFPFRRAYSPLMEGWVRSLIRQERAGEARQVIRRFAKLRSVKVRRLLETLRDEGPSSPGDSPMGVAVRALRWSDLSLPPRFEMAAENELTIPKDTALLEYWPDGDRVYIWVDKASESRFLSIRAPADVERLVTDLIRPMQRAKGYLPRPPTREQVFRISSVLIHPVEEMLRVPHLLIIPHRDLERAPFEMLVLRDGSLLGQRHTTSYLPSAASAFLQQKRVTAPPVALVSDELRGRSGAGLELDYFRQRVPRPRFFHRFGDWVPPRRARWVHLGTHFDLDDRFWQLTSLGGFRIIELLEQKLDVELLSLAACDTAHAGGIGLPYWLGTSELLLARGAQSLVVSRWQLDERSIPIFLDFYSRIEGGAVVSQALADARNSFLRKERKDRSLEHPFFWAGIIYVGWPLRTLSETQERSEQQPLRLLLSASGILIGLIWGGTRILRRIERGTGPVRRGPFPPK